MRGNAPLRRFVTRTARTSCSRAPASCRPGAPLGRCGTRRQRRHATLFSWPHVTAAPQADRNNTPTYPRAGQRHHGTSDHQVWASGAATKHASLPPVDDVHEEHHATSTPTARHRAPRSRRPPLKVRAARGGRGRRTDDSEVHALCRTSNCTSGHRSAIGEPHLDSSVAADEQLHLRRTPRAATPAS